MDRKDEENKISGENVVIDRDQALYWSRSSQSQEAQKLQRIAISSLLIAIKTKSEAFVFVGDRDQRHLLTAIKVGKT